MVNPILDFGKLNYQVWAAAAVLNARSVCMAGHLKVIKNCPTIPEAEADERLVGYCATWLLNDDQVFAKLLGTISATEKVYVADCETALDAWRILEQHHKPCGPRQVAELFTRGFASAFAPGTETSTTMGDIRLVSAQIFSAGLPATADDLTLISPHYNELHRRVLADMVKSTITIQDLEKLIIETSAPSTPASANAAFPSRNNRGGQS